MIAQARWSIASQWAACFSHRTRIRLPLPDLVAPRLDAQRVAEAPDQEARFPMVVALVPAEVLVAPSWLRARSSDREALERQLDQTLSCVLAPASARGTPLPSVRRERFVPDLPRSVGLGPVFSPAERRLDQRSIEALPAPVDALQLIVFSECFLPEPKEHAPLRPIVKVPMKCRRRTELAGRRIPLAAGPQNKQDAFEDSTPINARPASELADAIAREKRLHSLPEFIRSPVFRKLVRRRAENGAFSP